MIRVSLLVLFLCSTAAAAPLDSLILQLRLKLGQTDSTNNATTWSNDELRQCINMAQDMVATHSGGVQKLDTIQGAASNAIAAPSDFIHLRGGAWLWRDGQPITPIPYVPHDSLPKEVDRNLAQSFGIDNYFITEDANQPMIYPPVDTVDTILISYYAFPDGLSGSEESDFNQGWERVTILDACLCAWEKAQNFQMIQYYTQERDKQIEAMRALVERKPQVLGVP